MRKKITLKVYYTETDDGSIYIDEESIRDDFEINLEEIMKEAKKENAKITGKEERSCVKCGKTSGLIDEEDICYTCAKERGRV